MTRTGRWSVDLQTGAITWSDEDFRIFGYEPGEVEPSHEVVLRHIHPEDRHLFTEGSQKILSEGIAETRYRILRRDGAERLLWSRNWIEYAGDGTPLMLRGIVRDITDEKEAVADTFQT